MCGIVGIIAHKNVSHLEDTVIEMNRLQHHRGPDGEGLWHSPEKNIYFAHKRLSIIDLTEAASQPMNSHDNKYTIVFNGEIYNYQELRWQCIDRGSKFNSESDTEVIIEYIRHFGHDGIKDFRGMWTFALYDHDKNTVLLSRDPFGIKPLHYGIKDNTLYFASEIKSLRLTDEYFNEVDETTKQMYLDHSYLDIGDWTFFRNIQRFPAAHYGVIELDQENITLNKAEYWSPPKKLASIDEKEAIHTLDTLLGQSIERHMVSDVPVSFCLSGGLDSSTIVAIASQKTSKGQSLNSFTTHYPDFPEIDETKWAKKVVKYCGVNAHWVEPTYEEFEREFIEVLYHHDEPFGSTSIYAQNSIFNAITHNGFKVSLDGQGADEIFAGYHSYYAPLLLSLLALKKRKTVIYEMCALLIRFPSYLLDRRSWTLLKRKLINKLPFKKEAKQPSVNPVSLELQERLDWIKSRTKSNNFHEHLLNSLTVFSIPNLLRNGDRASMKSSVESRVPFLDIDLVNFVISLPDNFKIRRAVTKYILRKIALSYLPEDVVNRKDKMGFPAPEKMFLKKLFNIDVAGSFDKKWRELIIKEWETMIRTNYKVNPKH